MANELCASGFGNGIDGQYNLMYTDHWTNGTYWIYKDSWWWMISTSEFLYEPTYLVAIKPYTAGTWANGDYYAVGPWENGNWTHNDSPIGTISLGVCP
jgi:hypothetical protein